MYAFNQTLITINEKFRTKIIKNYHENKTYKTLLLTLRKLVVLTKKESESSKFIYTEMNFVLRNELIYHIKNNRERLCISSLIEKIILKVTYDDCNHADYHRVSVKLLKIIYIHKLLKKLITYI